MIKIKWIRNIIHRMAVLKMKRKFEAQGFHLTDAAIETLVREEEGMNGSNKNRRL